MEITYHSYQQILDLHGEGPEVLKQRRARRKFKKSTSGCLHCKQKRKKCDEAKPQCTSCARKGVECVWPPHVTMDKITVGTVEETKEEPLSENQDVKIVLAESLEEVTPSSSGDSVPIFDLNFTDDPLLYEFLHIQSLLQEEEDTRPSALSRRSSSAASGSATNYEDFEHTIPGVHLTREEARCYDAFVSTFLSSITPAHCDPLLSPMTLLLPYAVESTTVREIFLACGATQLAYEEDEFVAKSYHRYVKAVGLLVDDIQQSSDGCEDSLFIAVQLLQTLSLRDKSLGLNATKSAGHLAAAFEILKKRFLKCATAGGSMGLRLSPLDRVLTEHFIFNFPITLILCRHDKLSKVPSPFQFFEQFGGMLRRPFYGASGYAEDDEWANHPILGISLTSHEICTKTTWLMRTKPLPLDPENALRALELREQTTSELARLSSALNDNLTNAQKQSIAFAKSKLYGASIILRKLCQPALGIEDVAIQHDLSLMIKEMRVSKNMAEDHLLSLWAMFVGGSCAVKKEDREWIQEGYESTSAIIKSSLAQKVLRYLNIIWDEQEHVGLEFLFDTTVLDVVCT